MLVGSSLDTHIHVYRIGLSVDEVTASANEVTDIAGFIGRENVACPYRELG